MDSILKLASEAMGVILTAVANRGESIEQSRARMIAACDALADALRDLRASEKSAESRAINEHLASMVNAAPGADV